MRSRIYLVILGILALALVAAGCGKKADVPAENSGSSAPAGGDPAKGKTVYANCTACHGAKGEGGVGPNFAPAEGKQAVDERLSEADHIAVVTDGRTGKIGFMPAWKDTLSDDDIRNVVAYEREVLAKGNQ